VRPTPFAPAGKSTLTDSLVAAAGIIAIENVRPRPALLRNPERAAAVPSLIPPPRRRATCG